MCRPIGCGSEESSKKSTTWSILTQAQWRIRLKKYGKPRAKIDSTHRATRLVRLRPVQQLPSRCHASKHSNHRRPNRFTRGLATRTDSIQSAKFPSLHLNHAWEGQCLVQVTAWVSWATERHRRQFQQSKSWPRWKSSYNRRELSACKWNSAFQSCRAESDHHQVERHAKRLDGFNRVGMC